MSELITYDIIVIGSGGGAKIARPAAKKGFSVAIIEKDNLGGTCLNRGCIPSKMLIHPADVALETREAQKFHLNTTYQGVQFSKLTKEIYDITNGDSQKIHSSYESGNIKNLTFYKGLATFKGPKLIQIGEKLITATTIIIGVGARPNIPIIEGLKETPFMTSTQALRKETLPKHLVVLGGGYIGCELGHAYEGLGSKVTFLTRGGFLGRIDSQVKEEFTKAFSKRVEYLEQVSMQSVQYNGEKKEFTLTFSQNGEEKTLCCDDFLVATGVVPNTDLLDLEKAELEVDSKGFLKVDENLQTSTEGVYALGDCIGTFMFRHSANFQAEYLFEKLVERKTQAKIKYPPMPWAVFTNPQIAGVGVTEDELKTQNKEYIKGVCPYAQSAMGQALKSQEGFVKVLFCKQSKKLLGAQIIGAEASNMIHIAIVYITLGLGLDEMLDIIYVHPALPEILRNACRDAKKQFEK